jgi:NDP-sugar pyrophosphorylase family protein
MKAVILAGGPRQPRMGDETALRPKPLVEVGGTADFLRHILKILYQCARRGRLRVWRRLRGRERSHRE